MKHLFLTLFAILTVFTFHGTTNAQTIDAKGEETLKTLFQDFLDYQKTTNDAFGGLTFHYEGDLQVNQADTYYEVKLPVITVKPPKIEGQFDEESVMMKIDAIRINAVPAEDGLWTTTWTFPKRLTLKGENSANDFHIEFGDQKTVGVLSESLGYFTKMNMNVYDINFKVGDAPIGTTVGGVNLFSNFAKSEKQPDDGSKTRYTGPFNITFSDIVIAPPNDPEVVKIGEFKVTSTLSDAALPTLKEYEATILKHKDTFSSLNIDPNDPDAAQNLDNSKILDMIIDLYNIDMSGFDFAYTVKGMSYLADQNSENRPFDEMTLDNASFSLGTKNMDSEAGNIMLETKYDGLKVVGENKDELSTLSPNALKFNLNAENVPFTTLSKLASTTLRAIAENPDSAQFAAMGIMFKLPAIFAQAKTKLNINDNYANAQDYEISLDGEVLTDLTAMTGFIAKFTSVFAGMDTVITKITAFEQKQNAANDNENGEASEFTPSSMLKTLLSLRKIAKPTNKTGAYQFEFEATPEGQFLLNGQNAAEVLQ